MFSSSFAVSASRVPLSRHDRVDEPAVEGGRAHRCTPACARRRPWGCCSRRTSRLPGSIRSGEKARWKSRARDEAAGLEDRTDDLVGGPRIGRRLEDHQHAGLELRGDRSRPRPSPRRRSGPPSSDRGVGTQMTIASASPSRPDRSSPGSPGRASRRCRHRPRRARRAQAAPPRHSRPGCRATGRLRRRSAASQPERPRPQTGQAPRPWWPARARRRRSAAPWWPDVRRARIRRRRERSTCRGELQSALVAVAGVDGPVAAGLAAGDLVPFAVGGRAGLAGEREAAATDDCAGEGDLCDGDRRCGGLAMPSTHECVNSSRQRPRGQLSGSGWRGCPADVSRRRRLHPKEPLSAPGPAVRWTGWVPRLHPVVRRCALPDGWSSALSGTAGQPIWVDWLGIRP